MGAALSLLILAIPALLVCAVFAFWRSTPLRARRVIYWLSAGAWAISAWFWVSYSNQQDDVGLMVQGIFAMATSVSALVTTVVAFVVLRKL